MSGRLRQPSSGGTKPKPISSSSTFDPEYPIVRKAVDVLVARGYRLCYAAQNLVEFWDVCTRPIANNGFGLSTAETDVRVKIVEGRIRFLP